DLRFHLVERHKCPSLESERGILAKTPFHREGCLAREPTARAVAGVYQVRLALTRKRRPCIIARAMPSAVERITVFCFAASYGVALVLELWHHFQPRPIGRLLSLVFGAAGLVAHTAYILVQMLPLSTPQGSLLFLAWILAVFYLYGSIHHRRLA